MARFSTVSDEDLEKLIQEKDAKNTKRVISVQYNIFEQYCKEKKINMDIQTIEKRALDDILAKFYVEVRKTDGEYYKKSSFAVFVIVISFSCLLLNILSFCLF